MRNIKKLALGLIVGAMAIGGSAYTSSSTKYIGENFVVQISAYRFKPVWNMPDPGMCINNDTTTFKCFYNITFQGKINMPLIFPWQTYSQSQMIDWLNHYPNPYVTVNTSASKGIYYYGD